MRVTSDSRHALTCPVALIGLLLTACTQPQEALETRLHRIAGLIEEVRHSGITGDYRYSFTHDSDFPCSVTLIELNNHDGNRWQREYRFDLSDMAPGSLLRARAGRRAISYYSKKTTGEETRTFSPKKINAIRLYAPADSPLQALFDAVIAECVERNAFE